jgi:alkanesulfonate monooxygenase SsuD/methylene tetrahydromethanopterin reductase-like flavin-dependent oxidoreductase (luciferase family)
MAIPLAGGAMASLLDSYRDAWKAAGHPGDGKVMLAFHMLCHAEPGAAAAIAREPLNKYLQCLVDAASAWTEGTSSADYPGYDKIIEGLASETFESQVDKGAAWIGTPAEIGEQIADYRAAVGDFDIASLQVNFYDIPLEPARASVDLFGREVIPRFADVAMRPMGGA